jgi:Icc protein
MLIAQFTDTHIKPPGRLAYGKVDTAAFLSDAVAALAACDPRPDCLLVTGDLVDAGTAEEYALLRALLAPLSMPVYLIPGNHDERQALRNCFADFGYWPDGDFLHYAIEDWPVRLIALDTLVPGRAGGALCERRLSWLSQRLEEQPDRPTVIFMHHPPFRTGIAHMDAIGLEGADGLSLVLSDHPQVERVLSGHLHRPIQARVGGTIASTAPSTAHQVTLDLRPDGPSSFTMEPPGYQLHHWAPGAPMVSHTALIGGFAGPFPFFGADGKLID